MLTRGRSVLIVEDEAIVALDLQEMLRDMGYDAFAIAASADEAVAASSARCPDIVLMDIRIRGARDGIDTAALLAERFDVPVLYLTAHADVATVARATTTQPFGYLLKPVKSAELRTSVEIALQRHAMERQLRARERWFATTLQSISDGVIAVDLEGKVTYMNAAAAALTGVATEDAIGRPGRDVLGNMAASATTTPLDDVLSTRRVALRDEATVAGPGRDLRIISDGAAPVVDNGTMLGAVMVFRDVTAERTARRQVEVSERLRSLGAMAAGLAHEVNNPLAVVVANASYVLEELEPRVASTPELAGAVEAQQELGAAAQRIARTISDLQVFARSTGSSATDADIPTAVDWAIRTTARLFRGRGTIGVDLRHAPRVRIDPPRLGQVLVNVLANAARAIPERFEGESVVVRARPGVGEAVIEVVDRGAGMNAEVLARAFDPFFTTHDVGEGSGLGLAVCHGIVTAAGGRISIDSQPGRGTTVSLHLPVVASVALTTLDAAERLQRGRILLVEDEPLLLKALGRILKEHELTTVTNARDALAAIERGETFDLIISDMMMPSMSGMDLYRAIAAIRPELVERIVFLTGGSVVPPYDEFLASIPNERLEKPVRTEVMRTFVQERLARRS